MTKRRGDAQGPGANAELTTKAKAFLDEWVQTGDVSHATRVAGYTQPKNGFLILKKDSEGVYEDPRVPAYLISIGADPYPAVDAEILPRSPNQKYRPHNATTTATIRTPPTYPATTNGGPPPCPATGPTVEWQIQVASWILGDHLSSANAKIHASKELRILMAESGQQRPDPEKAIRILRSKMLPHVPAEALGES